MRCRRTITLPRRTVRDEPVVCCPCQYDELTACPESDRPHAIIREQGGEALHDDISTTPTLHQQGDRTLLLPGQLESDTRLSWLNLLLGS